MQMIELDRHLLVHGQGMKAMRGFEDPPDQRRIDPVIDDASEAGCPVSATKVVCERHQRRRIAGLKRLGLENRDLRKLRHGLGTYGTVRL